MREGSGAGYDDSGIQLRTRTGGNREPSTILLRSLCPHYPIPAVGLESYSRGENMSEEDSDEFLAYIRDEGFAGSERHLGVTHWLSHTEMKLLADSGVSLAISATNNLGDDSPITPGGMTFRLHLVARNGREILHIDSFSLGGCVAKLREENSTRGGDWEGIMDGEMLYE